MEIRDILRPLRQFGFVFVILGLVFSALVWLGMASSTNGNKSTLYFSVISQGQAPNGDHQAATEGAERMAEAISGWAKDPAFRQQILDGASPNNNGQAINIVNFKQKLSARKQNRLNVFYTLSLSGNELDYTQPMLTSLQKNITQSLDQLNTSASYQFGITPPAVYTQSQSYPLGITLPLALLLGFFLSGGLIYLLSAASGRITYRHQVEQLFPGCLVFESTNQDHNNALMNQFLLDYDSPRLIQTCKNQKAPFSLNPASSIQSGETPILVIDMMKTKTADLQNLSQVFYDEVGIILL